MNSVTVDLIYLVRPLNSNQTYNAPMVGSKAAGAALKSAWTFDDAGMSCTLQYRVSSWFPERHSAIGSAMVRTRGDESTYGPNSPAVGDNPDVKPIKTFKHLECIVVRQGVSFGQDVTRMDGYLDGRSTGRVQLSAGRIEETVLVLLRA